MQCLGLEVANFLMWFAETHKIPVINEDGTAGGFDVLGWSMGNATTLALLAHPEVIGKATYQNLEPYVRRFILYGAF
jgi:hypothetical protein